MTIAQAEKVLAVPAPDLALGVRDQAMLEVLYSTGIGRTELGGLNL